MGVKLLAAFLCCMAIEKEDLLIMLPYGSVDV